MTNTTGERLRLVGLVALASGAVLSAPLLRCAAQFRLPSIGVELVVVLTASIVCAKLWKLGWRLFTWPIVFDGQADILNQAVESTSIMLRMPVRGAIAVFCIPRDSRVDVCAEVRVEFGPRIDRSSQEASKSTCRNAPSRAEGAYAGRTSVSIISVMPTATLSNHLVFRLSGGADPDMTRSTWLNHSTLIVLGDV